MAATIITTEDLHDFKIELLNDIKSMIIHQAGQTSKKWLKSQEVRKFLSISPGTLQNFRINGTLSYTKIGSVIYYDFDEIQDIMKQNKVHNKI